jgi:hypothetical protein
MFIFAQDSNASAAHSDSTSASAAAPSVRRSDGKMQQISVSTAKVQFLLLLPKKMLMLVPTYVIVLLNSSVLKYNPNMLLPLLLSLLVM